MLRKLFLVFLALGIGLSQINAQTEETTQVESPKKQNVVGKVFSDMKESARVVNEINKENITAEKAAFSERHDALTEPDPAFAELRETKGLKNKIKVVFASIRENCKENSEKEKEFRAKVQSHETYRNLLAEQHERREAAIYGRY
jgi:hypothetical protein